MCVGKSTSKSRPPLAEGSVDGISVNIGIGVSDGEGVTAVVVIRPWQLESKILKRKSKLNKKGCQMGLEPTTTASTVRRSAVELLAPRRANFITKRLEIQAYAGRIQLPRRVGRSVDHALANPSPRPHRTRVPLALRPARSLRRCDRRT